MLPVSKLDTNRTYCLKTLSGFNLEAPEENHLQSLVPICDSNIAARTLQDTTVFQSDTSSQAVNVGYVILR